MCKDELRDETRRLTPDQRRNVAEFVNGLAQLVIEQLPAEETKTAGDVSWIMGYAAAACIYVGEFAPEQCVFSVHKEEKK